MKKAIIFSIILLPFLLSAQTIKQDIERSGKIFIGTPFKLHVTLETSLEDTIYSPKYDSLDVFFLKGEPEQTELIEENNIITNVALTFQAFDTGEYTFPELEFLIKNRDSQKILKTKEFVVIVESVIADSSQAIQDIAAPLYLKLSFWDYFLIAAALAFIILIIFLIKWLRKKFQKEDIAPVIKDTRPAYLKALEMLDAIDFESLLQSGQFVEYHYKLSIVLRYFLELHYNLNAVEMTTSEIKLKLTIKDHKEKNDILNLLREADKVKFAKYIPDSNTARELLQWLKNYLNSFETQKEEDDNAGIS